MRTRANLVPDLEPAQVARRRAYLAMRRRHTATSRLGWAEEATFHDWVWAPSLIASMSFAMADTTLDGIEKKLTDALEAYQRDFAGKDRSTCDPELLVGLVASIKSAMGDLDAIGALTAGEGSAALRTRLEQQAAIFERERGLILAAKEMGDSFEKFAIEGAAANFAFDRYQRHYAGQGRDTRDLGLLKELIEELRQVRKRMTAMGGKKLPAQMQNDISLVASNIERYQVEEREIPKAQATGTPEEQGDRYAFLANQQFAIYAAHFAGQSRLTRRPAMLVRLTDNLKRYKTAMFDLKTRGLKSDSNQNNIQIVDGRIKAWETELAEIRKVRSGVKLVDIMSSLGGSANDLFKEYRDDFAGKDRSSVSLEQLGLLLDRLDELRRQMEELGRVEKNDVNLANQRVVREYQSSWVQEYQAVAQAQAATSAAG